MRKFIKGLCVSILLGALLLALPAAAQSISKSISVYFDHVNIQVNGEEIESDNFLYKGTTYIPLREVAEILGKKIDYNNNTKTVFITDIESPETCQPDTVKPDTTKPDIPDTIEPDTPDTTEPDTPDPTEPNIPDTTEPDTPDTSDPDPSEPEEPDTVEPDTPDPVISSAAINGAELGMTRQELIKSLGSPDRTDPSVHGFTWYIYNQDYKEYVQVGIKDNQVVAVYSNIGNWQLKDKIGIGTSKNTVENQLGERLTSVTEGNSRYSLSSSNENIVYRYDSDSYAYVFYDKHNSHTVTGIMIWSNDIPFRDIYWGNYQDFKASDWQKAMEKQMFDLCNTFRVRMGLEPFTTDDKIQASAYLHSYDMSTQNYFSHTNLQGESPFDRMRDQGISYSRAGENIAYGQRNAIFANHGLMNSEGHRRNILGSYTRLGVGVHFNTSRKQAYYTQNFYTPRN